MKNIKDIKKATILLKIFSVVLFLGTIGYIIHNYVKNGSIDAWCICLAIFFSLIIAFIYFTKTFLFCPKAKRNRILLYVIIPFVFAIPSVLSIICEFISGKYLENADVMSMINSGFPKIFVLLLWVFIVLFLYSIICAVVAIYVEKSIVPRNEELVEELKAKLEIEMQKQKAENTKQNKKK